MGDVTREGDEKLSSLDDLAVVRRIRQNIKADKAARQPWAKEADEAFKFVAGDQWTDAEEAQFIDERRIPIKFNRVGPIIDVVCGMEVSNRQEVKYLPREASDNGQADVWNAAAEWARDSCNAEDEESEAFADAVVCGVGWTETRLDYDRDPDGMIVVERVDPFEVIADGRAKKRNLEDMRRVSRVQRRPLSWVRETWPDKADDIEADDFLSREDGDIIGGGGANRRGQKRFDGDGFAGGYTPSGDREVEVIEHQYFESEPYYRVQDPQTRQFMDLSVNDALKLRDRMAAFGMPFGGVKLKRDVAYRCFIAGNVLLERGECPDRTSFTLKAITGKRDRTQKTWFGLTRALMDPQRLANKSLSLMIDILSNTAKGGFLVEKGAIPADKIRDFEETIADYRRTTTVENGALSQGRVQPKVSGPMPPALPQLLDFASQGFASVSGVSVELMGLTQAQQPAALEITRKQAGFTMLATLFDALRRYRKQQGGMMLHLIRDYLADGRIIRITGKTGEQYVPLIRQPGAVEYDVIVDDAPTSPNQKERVWAILQSLLPMLKGMGVPMTPELLDYLPLPESLIAAWKKMLQPNPQAQQEQAIQKRVMLETAKANIRKDNASAAKNEAEAAQTAAETQGGKVLSFIEALKASNEADLGAAQNDAMGVPSGIAMQR